MKNIDLKQTILISLIVALILEVIAIFKYIWLEMFSNFYHMGFIGNISWFFVIGLFLSIILIYIGKNPYLLNITDPELILIINKWAVRLFLIFIIVYAIEIYLIYFRTPA